MSFSQDVKEELEKVNNNSRHCQIAEMASYVLNLGEIRQAGESFFLVFKTEREGMADKIKLLLKKLYGIEIVKEEKVQSKGKIYRLCVNDGKDTQNVLQSVKMWPIMVNQSGEYHLPDDKRVNDMLVKNSCCKRAFLMGTFLCNGSMSSPDKSYHLEIVSYVREQLLQINEIVQSFDIESKITTRKNLYVLYCKEGSSIVDLLNIMGAHVSLMNMENVIILKDMRNLYNRRVNCEAANIIKSINAASRQVEDIKYLQKIKKFESLPEGLKTMALVRLDNPDVPLKDLGNLLDPPVGKSGVNHRLRRISEIADEYRSKEN